jgi:hypothetical protein
MAPDFQGGRTQIRPTLLVMAHPRCPCTGATIEELARIMDSAQGALNARVYFYKPAGASDAWTQTPLWHSASRIPGVQVAADVDGRNAHRFGAATSGQAMLYGADGGLQFSGGLTDSRGHSSVSAGGRAILALLSQPKAELVTTPVYGCSLLSPDSASSAHVTERQRIAP